MKNMHLTITILVALIAFFGGAARAIHAQDADSVKQEIAAADKEEVRLLQEELRLKQKRNAEIAGRISQLKAAQNDAGTPTPPAGNPPATGASGETPANPPATENTSSNGTPGSNGHSGAPPRIAGSSGQTVSGKKTDNTNSLEKDADPRCSTFPGAGGDPNRLKEFSIFRQQLCALIEESKPTALKPAKINFAFSSAKLARIIVAKTVVDTDSPKLLNARAFLLKADTARTDN